MSPLTHLDEAAFFIHALGKQINYDCPFVEGQIKIRRGFIFPHLNPMTSLVFKNVLEIET
jgi:hypothetical protein